MTKVLYELGLKPDFSHSD